MKVVFMIFVPLLSGCALTAGETAYTVEPVETAAGLVCCKVNVKNTKNYDKFKFKLIKQADGGMTVELTEEGVSASDPAAVQAENNNKLLDVVTSIIPKIGGGGA